MTDLSINVPHDVSLQTIAVVQPRPIGTTLSVNLLFPTPGGTQYGQSNGSSVDNSRTFIIAQTNRNATMKWDTANVPYASMANTFFNTGGWVNHVHQFFALATDSQWPTYTYYYAAKDDVTGETTATASITFTVDHSWPSGTIPDNFHGVAISQTAVKMELNDPGPSIDSYHWYRNGVLLATTSVGLYIDTTASADTIYNYQASVTIGGVEQAKCPNFPVHTLPSSASLATSANVMKQADMESGLIIINNSATNDWDKYLWNNYPFAPGTSYADAVISTTNAITPKDGTHSFQLHMTGNFVAPYTSAAPPSFEMTPFTADNARHFAREYLVSGVWAFNTFNRMRFWIKVPSDWPIETGGKENFQVGTYVGSSHRNLVGAGAEEAGFGGNHFYHHYNVPYTDHWYQIILDTHPTHQRQGPGNQEWGMHTYFSGEPGWTYFDALSRWYVDTQESLPVIAFPTDFYIDDIEFFSEDESLCDTNHIYAIHGGYHGATGTVYAGWGHPKNDAVTKADVRYAFSDLHALGFTNGTVFPGTAGGVSPLSDVYNCQLVSTAAINLTGQTAIYVGIRQQGDGGFRQIIISLTE